MMTNKKYFFAILICINLTFLGGCQSRQNSKEVSGPNQNRIVLPKGQKSLTPSLHRLSRIHQRALLTMSSAAETMADVIDHPKINKAGYVAGSAIYGARAELFVLQNLLRREKFAKEDAPIVKELIQFMNEYDLSLAERRKYFLDFDKPNQPAWDDTKSYSHYLKSTMITDKILTKLVPVEYRTAYQFNIQNSRIKTD